MSSKESKNKTESKSAIIAAITGNALIAVTKFIAAALTGSSAMFSEGFHSIVDTGNGGLMLYGVYRSKQPSDADHPFGHGKELYFWSLVVAFGIFAVGGGVSIYEGILHIIDPVEISNPFWNYIVLGFSTVFESYSLYYAWKTFKAVKKDKEIVEAIQVSKDPTTFTVLLEDSAALTGILIAFLGIFFGHQFEMV